MFNFIITEEMRGHGEGKLNLGVEVKVNNIQTFKKQLNSALEFFFQQEPKAAQSCNYLFKASAHKQSKNIENETGELLRMINTLYHKTEAVFYEDRTVFSSKFEELISYIQEGRQSFQLDKIGTIFFNFCEWLKETLIRKIDMCDKLGQLANRPLKAIITFKENGYETQFTKYHLNLEHFSELMHKLLKEEFNLQHINHYVELEKEHFLLMSKLKDYESIKIVDFLSIADKVLQNQTKLDKIRKPLLVAQVNYKGIQENIQSIINTIYNVSNKFEELYAVFSSQKDSHITMLDLYRKIMGVVYKLTVKDFLDRKDQDFIKFYDFVKVAKLKEEDIFVDRMLYFNLEKIEPNIGERLKTKIINEFKVKENCNLIDTKGQFMIKKNDKGIFDRNCYYTHSLLIYEFIPKRVDQVKNKYTLSSGYDKILVDKKTLRFSGKVFSVFLNREITYDIFLEVCAYNINLSNHYSSKVA